MPIRSEDDALADPHFLAASRRGLVRVSGNQVIYSLKEEKRYDWRDPEEWVRACTIAWLIVDRDYPATRMRTEVIVPRRTPSDSADIVVFRDDACREPYLVVENKADPQNGAARAQGIEQLFGNANSLRATMALYDEGGTSIVYDVANFPQAERERNRLGDRTTVPKAYGQVPQFALVAGGPEDISPASSHLLEARIRRAHGLIWAGGKRDPLQAFDDWSKVLFAKVVDERSTPSGAPRRFQVGTNETVAAVANRVHELFAQACRDDPTIFLPDTRITLPDAKLAQVVEVLQSLSFTRTDIDSIGRAFEQFFGSIFRGGLGQYFTMRQLARFTVGLLDIKADDFVIDPTAGSGGFLLEVLLQTWHRIEREYAGQGDTISRLRTDFALHRVYGIEIHEVLARICKINLLLHHDGHTNIEGGRSCLDTDFTLSRLRTLASQFSVVVGNPPFGDDVEEGDEEKLGSTPLEHFVLADGRHKVASEHIILERAIEFLQPGGRLGLIVPDGLLNNQGEQSNCPGVRRYLASRGRIKAIVSLPDYAFRKSGAQNKTSILFFEKFNSVDLRRFGQALSEEGRNGNNSEAIVEAIVEAGLDYPVFLAEANWVGYTPTGQVAPQNDLYRSMADGSFDPDQSGTILGEYQRFLANPASYDGATRPDCEALLFSALWRAHSSQRLDPKYHLFKREMRGHTPPGWLRLRVASVMERRYEPVDPIESPDDMFTVLTISQTGTIRAREAGKGKNPPEWRGTYFDSMSSAWFAATRGDIVYSSIDLWKGCIAVVPEEFDGGLVTKEFPIYRVTDERIAPEFLQCLLRSRYYQRAFRAITTGHSNRRRTQTEDFEALEICFPEDRSEQARMVAPILLAQESATSAGRLLGAAVREFDNLVDGRGDEELPVLTGEDSPDADRE